MMIAPEVLILPNYSLMVKLGLNDTRLGIALPFFASAMGTLIVRQTIKTIPIELEEAAKIDGAGVFRTFSTITFPLLKPVIATVAILNTLNVWNDFMGPLYFLQTRENDVILQYVYRNIGQFSTDWTSQMCIRDRYMKC